MAQAHYAIDGAFLHRLGPELKDMWEWMNEIGEGFGEVRESNWMSTWRQICKIYIVMKREIVEEGRLDSNSDPSPKNKVVGER